MKKSTSFFTVFRAVFFFVFAAFMFWFIPSSASLRSEIAKTQQELELNRGREAKQQYEYDKAVEELPLKLAELEKIKPQADEAEQVVAGLKARKKELLAQKKELEDNAGTSTAVPDEEEAEKEESSDE